jgi:hypothetical protein
MQQIHAGELMSRVPPENLFMPAQTHRPAALPIFVAALLAATPAACQDALFSGPQVGEKTTPFRVLAVTGSDAGKEIDPTAGNGVPTVLVFLHGLERSMVPLMTTIDRYGAEKKQRLKTLFVALAEDRVAAEQRLPLVARSVRLESPLTLSLDGLEGPGNYGLNRKCLMTVVMARENRVTANFALVQPGIADAPRVLSEMAKLAGDAQPPSPEELRARRGDAGRPQRPQQALPRPVDLSRLDLSTQEGLRDAVRLLLTEVRALREEVQRLREQGGPEAGPARPGARPEIPGAAPTDPKLLGLLRSFIQPSNDSAAVDRILAEVETYVGGAPALKKQAVDGWTRVLYLKYGTEYAQKAGRDFVGRLKR